MFNDPSGEFWEAGALLTAVAIAIQGTLVGTIVAAGMYILKSLVNNTWSWGGFARSLLIGAITGAATGGLTGGMSASGFNGAVIVGSMNGAIAGGVYALFNKENFFTGMYRGAVMGAAIGGITGLISSTFQYFSNKKPTLTTLGDLKNQGYDLTTIGEDYTSTLQVRSDFDNLVGDYEVSTSNINNEMKLASNADLNAYNYNFNSNGHIQSNDIRDTGYILGFNVGKSRSWLSNLFNENLGSITYISPTLGRYSDGVKKAVMGHEYIHGYHRYIGLAVKYSQKAFHTYTEASAHQFSLGVSTIFGDSWYQQSELGMFLNYGGKFPSAFDWKPALYKISNLKLFK